MRNLQRQVCTRAGLSPHKISSSKTKEDIRRFVGDIRRCNPGEKEFHQAVHDVARSVFPYIADKPWYREQRILERIAEPDRVVMFRVCWEDDEGNTRVNRGYRVQNNNAIGPYKGGIRFHPNVTLSVLKFLAFEQTFKNALTGLPIGGGKGGADFDPKGKSDGEVMRFCQSFMTELYRHIGPNMDVPAGDIGVGAREIGYLFGQYKRLTSLFVGVLTGKGIEFGGSHIRAEATGYGVVYFMQDMLELRKDSLEGKTCVISGAGNVALHAVAKIIQFGGKPVTLSDSTGFIYDADGIDEEKLAHIKDLKEMRREGLSEYAQRFGVEFFEQEKPWRVPCDLAFPCATENEISKQDAQILVSNGCRGVSEGANMPTTSAGVEKFLDAKICYGPGKAANAGGVAVSALEMRQNNAGVTWAQDELQKLLLDTMRGIHDRCVTFGQESDMYINYCKGANIAGFVRVADALMAYGVV